MVVYDSRYEYKHDEFVQLLREIEVHHNKKGAQYAKSEDPFENFRNSAKLMSRFLNPDLPLEKVGPVLAALAFVTKQIDSVFGIFSDPEKLEDKRLLDVVEEHSIDVAVYFLIIVLMIRGMRGE